MSDKQLKSQFTEFDGELLDQRVICLKGEISAEKASRIKDGLLILNARGNEPITLYIDSSGGGVETGLDIYDAVRLSAAPVIGLVTGIANSMACVVLQGCRKRQAYRNSQLVAHDIQLNVDDAITVHDSLAKFIANVRKQYAELEVLQQRIDQIFSLRTGKPEDVRRLLAAGKKLTAVEAKVAGLIDEIL